MKFCVMLRPEIPISMGNLIYRNFKLIQTFIFIDLRAERAKAPVHQLLSLDPVDCIFFKFSSFSLLAERNRNQDNLITKQTPLAGNEIMGKYKGKLKEKIYPYHILCMKPVN